MKKSLSLCSLLFVIALAQNAQAGAWDKGWNFRGSSGYCTDPANTTYSLGTSDSNYPITRNGVTFGWTSNAGQSDADSGVDCRLAGLAYIAPSTTVTFQVDLPAAGDYDIRFANGRTDGSQNKQRVEIFDNTTSLIVVENSSVATDTYYDASNVNRIETNWPSQNVAVRKTFASTTFKMTIGCGDCDYTVIAHLFISQVQGLTLGGQAYDVNDASASSVGTPAWNGSSTDPVAGSVVVCASSWTGTATISCSDNASGNSYTTIGGTRVDDSGGNRHGQMCYAKNIATTTGFVNTLTYSGAVTNRKFLCIEIKGASITAPLDKSTGTLDTDNSTATDAVTTASSMNPAVAGEFFFGVAALMTAGSSNSAGTGYTLIIEPSTAADKMLVEYRVESGTTAHAITATSDNPSTAAAVMGATFSPTAMAPAKLQVISGKLFTIDGKLQVKN